ncbi:MAG: hypothetical protein R2695_11325 [Acidimicrobiales bacterium]
MILRARLAEAGVPVAFHLGDSGYEAQFGTAWGGRGDFGFGKSDPLGHVLALDRAIHDMIAALVVHGVFTRHPELRVASIENGSASSNRWSAPPQAGEPDPWVLADDPLDTLRRHLWVASTSRRTSPSWPSSSGSNASSSGLTGPTARVAQPLDFTKEIEAFSEADQQRIMRDNCLDLLGVGR